MNESVEWMNEEEYACVLGYTFHIHSYFLYPLARHERNATQQAYTIIHKNIPRFETAGSHINALFPQFHILFDEEKLFKFKRIPWWNIDKFLFPSRLWSYVQRVSPYLVRIFGENKLLFRIVVGYFVFITESREPSWIRLKK